MGQETKSGTKANTKADTASDDAKGTAATGATTEIIEFDLLHSAIYHDMRENFYGLIGRWFLFFTIILGSGAASAFFVQAPLYGQIAGIAVAVVGALSLVFDFTGRARDHRDLKSGFYDLLADIQQGCNESQIKSKMTRLYAEEPPVVRRVNRRAHDRAGKSLFGDDFTRA